jgi:hypothetical protein
MQSKLNINSSGVNKSLGLQTRCNKSMENKTLTHRMKDKEKRVNIKKISPNNWLRRVMGSLIKTVECGVSSTKSPDTTLLNSDRNNNWWLS